MKRHHLPQGFRISGVGCGIKQNGQPDVALVVADQAAVAAGVYTTNLYRAAPVEWDSRITPSDQVRAVVVNSGNANACTGERGWRDTEAMAQQVARAIGGSAREVLVLSTGIIGEFLPMDRVTTGIAHAAESLDSSDEAIRRAAEAMMTTDRVPKIGSADVALDDRHVSLLGLAKGAGMIGPRMATMLGIVLTDVRLTPEQASRLLVRAVDRSFHRISVDGHTSTNDTVLLLASGASGVTLEAEHEGAFAASLEALCIDLARQIPADGEGATHLISIHVAGCRCEDDALRIARTIADSPLVKTAIAGADPNWGRITSAAGYSGVRFDPEKLTLKVCDRLLFADGRPVDFDAAELRSVMQQQFEIAIELDIREGTSTCRFWASDLTHKYVTINAEYHT